MYDLGNTGFLILGAICISGTTLASVHYWRGKDKSNTVLLSLCSLIGICLYMFHMYAPMTVITIPPAAYTFLAGDD